MNATLTELHRKTRKVTRSVMAGGRKVTITEHGEPCLEIIPVPRIDRKAALAALRALGPVEFLPRNQADFRHAATFSPWDFVPPEDEPKI